MSVKVWDPAIAVPKDLDDALQLISQLETFQEKPNPKFLALSQALLADSAFAGHWGAERILEAAANCTSAIWEPLRPAGDAMPGVRAVIQHATALGLIAYRDSRQVIFLPGGGTVTPAQKALHDGDFEAYDARLLKRVEVCKTLLKGFTEHFASLGFSVSNLESGKQERFAGLSFADVFLCELSRPIRDGWQRLIVTVNDADADSEYFRCYVKAGIRNESVETIFTQVFGEGIRHLDTCFFSPAIFLREYSNNFDASNQVLIKELLALIERLAMPVLNLAQDLAGLDVVMNDLSRFPFPNQPHPLTPQNLADHFVSMGRQSCLKNLIVAWLNHNPNFESRVADLREFVKKRVDVSEADLDHLLVQLRSLPT